MPALTLVAADRVEPSALHAAFEAAFSDYLIGPFTLGPSQWPAFLARQAVDLESSRVALDHRGEIAAFAFVAWRDPRHARLATMGALQASRGSGAAAALLDEAIARLGACGAVRLELEVFAQNTRALRLYEGRGYAALQTLHGYTFDAPASSAAADDGGVETVTREAALEWLEESAAVMPDLPLQVTARPLAARTLPATAWRTGGAQLVFARVAEAAPALVNVLSLVDREASQRDASRLVQALIARHPGWRIQVPPLQRLDVGGQALRAAGFAALPLHQLWMAKNL